MRATVSTLTQEEVAADIARSIRELEPLPATARELVGLLRRPEASLRPIANLIELDEAIAATVFKAASSAAYSGFGRPASVREAIARLGTARLLDLVLRDYMTRLHTGAPLHDRSEEDLWAHSAAAELAVEAIIAERPRLGLPSLALTAALLHDIGKLVTARHFKASCQEVLDRAATQGCTFVEAERRLFGTDHALVGAAIGREWGFPDELVDAIARHHETPLTTATPVLDAVVVANLIAKTLSVDLGAEGLNFALEAPSAARLGLDYPAFARVCLRTEEWLVALLSSLRRGPEGRSYR